MASLVHILAISFIQQQIITCKLHGKATLVVKTRFAVALVVRGLLIVTSHTDCDVTSCPIVMRRYENAYGDEQRCKTSETQVFLGFFFYEMVILVEQKLTTYMLCAVVVGTAIRQSTRCAGVIPPPPTPPPPPPPPPIFSPRGENIVTISSPPLLYFHPPPNKGNIWQAHHL